MSTGDSSSRIGALSIRCMQRNAAKNQENRRAEKFLLTKF
jgi:hypothetical protein